MPHLTLVLSRQTSHAPNLPPSSPRSSTVLPASAPRSSNWDGLYGKLARLTADPIAAEMVESLVDALLERQPHAEPTCETGPTPGWKGRATDPDQCEHRSACGTYCTGS